MRSIIPEVIRKRGMFTRVQHALTSTLGKRPHLSAYVHDELHTWKTLLDNLDAQPTYLRELVPHPTTWLRATVTSSTGMGGICRYPSEKWWREIFPEMMQD